MVLTLGGVFDFAYEIFLYQSTHHRAAWILEACENIHFQPSDLRVFRINPLIKLLEGKEKERVQEKLKVDVNHASSEALEELPRVGPAIAKRIVDERNRSGPFRNLEDLKRVKGIGPKTLKLLKEWVRFDP